LAVAVLAVLATGCAIKVKEVTATVFKKDAKDAEQVAASSAAVAKVLLEAGKSASEVEAILRGAGLNAETAKNVVALAGAQISAAKERQ
jgi:hypothetical protein